jgi:tRNA threonylcarbamoyladenosine biosynthesis protein TsaB
VPIIFAIETSTERLSIAILHEREMYVREVHAGQRHSELALPLMRELMVESKLDAKDIDVYAFGQGPGSFTGVRIACGLTQGLALGAGKRVMPVPTQMALAETCGAGNVLVALDARMDEIYFAAYRRQSVDSSWEAIVAPMLVKPDALPPLDGGDWQGIGSAFDAPALSDKLTRRYADQIVGIEIAALPSAREIAVIAARELAIRGIEAALAPEFAAPLYLRNKVAMTMAERAAAKLKMATV